MWFLYFIHRICSSIRETQLHYETSKERNQPLSRSLARNSSAIAPKSTRSITGISPQPGIVVSYAGCCFWLFWVFGSEAANADDSMGERARLHLVGALHVQVQGWPLSHYVQSTAVASATERMKEKKRKKNHTHTNTVTQSHTHTLNNLYSHMLECSHNAPGI